MDGWLVGWCDSRKHRRMQMKRWKSVVWVEEEGGEKGRTDDLHFPTIQLH